MTERKHAADVLIIGAGPAGLAAAVRAAEHGRSVLIIDEGMRPGGQIWRHQHEAKLPAAAQAWLQRFHNSGATLLSQTTVIDIEEGRRVIAEANGHRCELTAHAALILATGARERFLPFPGWTLPGVVGVGGAQALLKAGLDVRGQRVVLAGSGPLLLAVAAALANADARLMFVAEQAPPDRLFRFAARLLQSPARLLDAVRYRMAVGSASYRAGVWVKRALGEGRVRAAVLTDGRREREIACDLLATGFGLVPSLELARRIGCDIERGFVRVDEQQSTSVPGVYCAGEPTGIGGVDAALVEGQIAGLSAAGATGQTGALRDERAAQQQFTRALERTFALRPELASLVAPDTIVCRCEDVSWQRLQGHTALREAKLVTRAGMGPCQGRICGSALQYLCGWEADTVRAPVAAARVGTLAGASGPPAASERERER